MKKEHEIDTHETLNQPDSFDIEDENSRDVNYNLEKENKDTTATDLTVFVAECVRFQVLDRAAVALYNAAIKTLGPLKNNMIVDKRRKTH